ncbi:hypothetical protein [Thalassoroseus pseudoceratinae]|uniref:hypothetical protein n=1 Tax=Thalassoroseus pseudoceratinae TaxID=2713176 RepID=UPI0014215D17|nr:hypothetical protein [Thalassoroseus pseudoceratinae]
MLPQPQPLPETFTKADAMRKRRRSKRFKLQWPFSLVESLVLLIGLALVVAGYLWKLNHPIDN